MLRLPPSIRIFVLTRPISLLMKLDGLIQLARDYLGEDPFSGNLFCFFNASRDRVKLLVWDRNGFWVFEKRLERGRYRRIEVNAIKVEISREQLVFLIAGIDPCTSRIHRDYVKDVRIPSRRDGTEHTRATERTRATQASLRRRAGQA